MSNIPTPHIGCNDKEMIADTVLMPGDPLRAKYIADNYLEDVVQFNAVRGALGYTGVYNGRKISVMASGMGMPSIGIYAYELFKFFDVKTIIRIGSCGGYLPELKLYDIILVDKCYTDSNYAVVFNNDYDDYAYPTESVVEALETSANELGIKYEKCCIHSSDLFYHLEKSYLDDVKARGCKAVEMESFALFTIAKALNKSAACLLTVSDSLCYSEEMTPEERETKFTEMIEIALNTKL